MSEIKWIKVAVDMFEDSKIEFIRSLPEGDAIIVTWIQMLSIAGRSNMGGYLLITEDIPYTEQFLCDKLRRTPTFMQFALETLIKLKMVNIEDGPFHITNWEKHQNIDGMDKVRAQNRDRKRVQREREKQLLLAEKESQSRKSHVTVTGNVTASHATDIDIDLDKTHIYSNSIQEHLKIYSVKCKGIYELELLTAYENIVPIDLMIEAIKRSEGKGVSYVITVLENIKTENKSGRGSSKVAKSGQAAHHKQKDPELEYRRMEIARNRWIDAGNDPNEFTYRPD